MAKAGGWVYAANRAGDIAGAFLSSFALLPWVGVRGTALAAALLNMIAGGWRWLSAGDPMHSRLPARA